MNTSQEMKREGRSVGMFLCFSMIKLNETEDGGIGDDG